MSTKDIVAEQKDIGLALRNRGYATIKDHKAGGVTISWQGMPRDMFRLKKDDKEMVLNKMDLLYILRNV